MKKRVPTWRGVISGIVCMMMGGCATPPPSSLPYDNPKSHEEILAEELKRFTDELLQSDNEFFYMEYKDFTLPHDMEARTVSIVYCHWCVEIYYMENNRITYHVQINFLTDIPRQSRIGQFYTDMCLNAIQAFKKLKPSLSKDAVFVSCSNGVTLASRNRSKDCLWWHGDFTQIPMEIKTFHALALKLMSDFQQKDLAPFYLRAYPLSLEEEAQMPAETPYHRVPEGVFARAVNSPYKLFPIHEDDFSILGIELGTNARVGPYICNNYTNLKPHDGTAEGFKSKYPLVRPRPCDENMPQHDIIILRDPEHPRTKSMYVTYAEFAEHYRPIWRHEHSKFDLTQGGYPMFAVEIISSHRR